MKAILLQGKLSMKCPRCNGTILKDDKDLTCLNCGHTLPDKFTKEFIFNQQTKKYEERYKEELITKALMRHKE